MANNKVNKNRHELSFTVEGEIWTKEINKAFESIRKNVKVDGFRPGKVTKEVFDKKFGKEDYLIQAANVMIEQKFSEVMSENKYKLVADPQIKINKMDEEKLEFEMILIEEPAVNVKKYKGLKIEKEKVEVTDEEVEHEIHHLLDKYAEMVVKESDVVENTDTAVIDFEGFKDRVAFEGGKAENYPLEIGSQSFIPGFEEQLIGMKKGEEKDINVTFPEEYHAEDLKGQAVVFKVKVNEIKVKKQREFDEELFEDLALDGVNSEETLKEYVKNEIMKHKEMHAEEHYIDNLLEEISKNVEVDIPEEMVFDVVERMFNNFVNRLSYQGINLESYSQITGQDVEQIRSEMEKEAFKRVLYRLTLEKIKELENITATDEEIEEKINEFKEKFKISEEEILKQIGNKEMLRYDLEMNKVMEFLKEENK